MFKKVLIANRGAIAVRIIRTLRKLDIQSLVVYSEADRDSLHVELADEAVSLGEGNATKTYLDQNRLFSVAKNHDAQAIHPGYGFLSENAEFAARCIKEGIVFLGPTEKQLRDFGLKHRAREIAEQNNIPLLPGSQLLTNLDEAKRTAKEIGFPIMLKSTAGGGGIGMSTCHNEVELVNAFESVKRLSKNNFSNDGVFVEKFISRARHIEVQVFGDGKGNALTLGERDCSAQRRNQKVIEETPAPNIPESVRTSLNQVAHTLASATHYQSAGTVEFIYDADTDDFFFLEMNTRLQVEHGITEQIFEIDLVEWMIKLGEETLADLKDLKANLNPKKHSIQVRIYAEDPNNQFQPSSGVLSQVYFPQNSDNVRIDHWIETGINISPYFDPMLAKIIITDTDRNSCLTRLKETLTKTTLYGIETNIDYVGEVLSQDVFAEGKITTGYLSTFRYSPHTINVLSPGTQTTIQDYPGRKNYWHVGIPPSGPFDNLSFRLGNQLLNNDPNAPGLEITLQGPKLKFNQVSHIVICGAPNNARIIRDSNEIPISTWQVTRIECGDIIECGKTTKHGSRYYLMISGGISCPDYLNSKSTFTLGQFGGHNGRALRTGDVIHYRPVNDFSPAAQIRETANCLHESHCPQIDSEWSLRVIYGPHGSSDFFTDEDIADFFGSSWEVHYNSSRTGIRLIGPKPNWARSDGGEAGMHPSNIHDNAYAIGAVDFTGDMPVILGPDGPSLGGFVCPATVITADLWKLGQLKAGDTIRFSPVTIAEAVELEKQQITSIESLEYEEFELTEISPTKCILKALPEKLSEAGRSLPKVIYRPQGDHYLLVEYGPLVLDINLRFRAHALMLWLEKQNITGVYELTPGVRSLQIHYNSLEISIQELLDILEKAEDQLDQEENPEVPARIVHLPLSWDDEACKKAIQKYMQSVRQDAPWCPSNIEFIRRINGLASINDVKRIVFEANYLVLGLGDVYLGAPVATPIDPRHRLVTTKYNPARTWTAENSVGIGGSYLCIYGMEGPGGYQFIGRTSQMWNRFKTTREFEKPWLLRFFDQIKFYEVTGEELEKIRRDFPKGKYPLKIENTVFNLNEYQNFIDENIESINEFKTHRNQSFAEELERWIESGQINFETQVQEETDQLEISLNDSDVLVESHIAGNIWQISVAENDQVTKGQVLIIVESMKMEIEIVAPESGKVKQILVNQGDQIHAGQPLLIVEI